LVRNRQQTSQGHQQPAAPDPAHEWPVVQSNAPGIIVQRLAHRHVQVPQHAGRNAGFGHDITAGQIAAFLRIDLRDPAPLAGDGEMPDFGFIVRSAPRVCAVKVEGVAATVAVLPGSMRTSFSAPNKLASVTPMTNTPMPVCAMAMPSVARGRRVWRWRRRRTMSANAEQMAQPP